MMCEYEEGKFSRRPFGTQDLVARLILAVDNFQIARQGPKAQEDDAFEILIEVRNDIVTAYYA